MMNIILPRLSSSSSSSSTLNYYYYPSSRRCYYCSSTSLFSPSSASFLSVVFLLLSSIFSSTTLIGTVAMSCYSGMKRGAIVNTSPEDAAGVMLVNGCDFCSMAMSSTSVPLPYNAVTWRCGKFPPGITECAKMLMMKQTPTAEQTSCQCCDDRCNSDATCRLIYPYSNSQQQQQRLVELTPHHAVHHHHITGGGGGGHNNNINNINNRGGMMPPPPPGMVSPLASYLIGANLIKSQKCQFMAIQVGQLCESLYPQR